ncbi:hypothetical protein EJB05_44230, partial [Eragrostis curvula]
MSQEINESQDGHASRSQVSSSDADDAVITKVDGEWCIQLPIVPLQGQSDGRATVQEMNVAFKGFLRLQDDDNKRVRTWLTLLATVAASVTYQAGLNPPGGFWQADDSQGHRAGGPVRAARRALVEREQGVYARGHRVASLIGAYASIGAYAAGSTLSNSSTIFIIILTCVIFVAIIYLGEVMAEICSFVMTVFPCMETMAQKSWCPISKGSVERAKKMKAETMLRRAEKRKMNPVTCCCCCCC